MFENSQNPRQGIPLLQPWGECQNALSDVDKYGEYFARTDIGAYTPIPTAKNILRCRWTEGCFGAILGINSFLSEKSAFCKNLEIALAAA